MQCVSYGSPFAEYLTLRYDAENQYWKFTAAVVNNKRIGLGSTTTGVCPHDNGTK